MTNKVTVAGATGLLGIAAIERFLDAGREVVAVCATGQALSVGHNDPNADRSGADARLRAP